VNDSDTADHPWLPFAGMFQPDDPVVQEWLEIIESRRSNSDAA